MSDRRSSTRRAPPPGSAAGQTPSTEARLHPVSARVPGRLRMAADGLLRNARLAKRLRERIASLPGVRFVDASPLTGRVLVLFDSAISHDDLLRRCAEALEAPAVVAEGEIWRESAGGRRRAPVAPPTGMAGVGRHGQGRRSGAEPLVASATAPRSNGQGATTAWHALQLESVVRALASDPLRGLEAEDARQRLLKHGRNAIEARPPTSALALFARQFASLPVGLLLGASATSAVTGGVVDALVTLAVIGGNAGLGFATESGSERIIRQMTAPQTSLVPVIRSGRSMLLPQDEIVPGDVLVLKPNVVVAADARLIACEQLTANEALLTGESEPVAKSASRACEAAAVLAERHTMVHRGSFIAGGSGTAVVVASGRDTEVGRIELETREIDTPRTPLERDLDNLGTKLATVSLIACGAFFAAGALRGRPLVSMMKSAVALAVAAVPEGLPVTATTTLALGLGELRRKGVIVRRLEAVEGLGSMQVVCFDKTGTLTENRMRLEQLHLGLSARVLDPGRDAVPAGLAFAREQLMHISILCSELEFDEAGRVPTGSSTETALAQAAIDTGIDAARLRADWPIADMAYRSETHRYMRSVHMAKSGTVRRVMIKGDPHQVLGLCRRAIVEGSASAPLTETARREIARTTDRLAGQGLRVLGFAFAEADGQSEDGDLVWVGAAGLKDPVAAGAKPLVARLRGAGIRPIMITGDQAATASSIAAEVGLNGDRPIRVLESQALDRMPPELLTAIAQKTDVFARVPPSRKLKIVQALQRGGHVVGMSGDGFNDAPALRAADIAIAVGKQSASAARDVADIIVGGGDLEAIADGVEQGRTILSNIRKSVHYLISTNLSEILVLLAESLIANDELESPLELLWLNLVTDILPALGLAFEPPERDVMSRPPRPSDEPLLTMKDLSHSAIESVVIGGTVLGAHAYGLARYGPGPQTRTVTFLSLVASQLLHALACRHDRFEPLGGRELLANGKLNSALLGSAAMQALAVSVPAFRNLLGIAAPRPADLLVAGASGLSAFAINEALMALRTERASRPLASGDGPAGARASGRASR